MNGGLSARGMAQSYARGRARVRALNTDAINLSVLRSVHRGNLECAWRYIEIGHRDAARVHLLRAAQSRRQIEQIEQRQHA